jgi:exosome complex RNA-binding protein Csl4
MAIKITKEDFQAYIKVQNSGRTNMFDLRNVVKLSGLSREKILEIMTNYRIYKQRWGVIKP